jgi:hypothetical protein
MLDCFDLDRPAVANLTNTPQPAVPRMEANQPRRREELDWLFPGTG